MRVNFLDSSSFLLKFKNQNISFSTSTPKPKALDAEILISSECSNFKGLCITGPGEYEKGGVYISGFSMADPKDENTNDHIAYLIVDNESRTALFTHPVKKIPEDISVDLQEVDVLFVPMVKDMELAPQKAFAAAMTLSPKLIIPFGDLEKDTIKKFASNAKKTIQCEKTKSFTKKDFTEVGVVAIFG